MLDLLKTLYFHLIILIFSYVINFNISNAQETSNKSEFLSNLQNSQSEASKKLARLTQKLDSFFGTNRIDEEYDSESRIRINLTNSSINGFGNFNDLVIRTRIILPNTERRFNLIFQDFTNDFTEQDESNQNVSDNQIKDKTYLAGLKFQPYISESWSLGVDGGLKLVTPVDPFARVRVRKSWWPEPWELRLTSSIFWFKSSGEGFLQEMDFETDIFKTSIFRWNNSATWLKENEFFTFNQSLNFISQLNEVWGSHFFVNLSGQSSPSIYATEYRTAINLRKRILSQWLFFNIQPGLFWPKELNFKGISYINFKIEAIIGDS